MKKKKVLLAKLLILLLCIFIGIILYVKYYNTKPFIKDVKYSDKYNKDRSKDVTLYIIVIQFIVSLLKVKKIVNIY